MQFHGRVAEALFNFLDGFVKLNLGVFWPYISQSFGIHKDHLLLFTLNQPQDEIRIENTQLPPEELSFSGKMNNEVFIEDLEKRETYSLLELAVRLDHISGRQYGELTHEESFNEAFLLYDDIR